MCRAPGVLASPDPDTPRGCWGQDVALPHHHPFTHSGPFWSRGSRKAKRLCSEATSGGLLPGLTKGTERARTRLKSQQGGMRTGWGPPRHPSCRGPQDRGLHQTAPYPHAWSSHRPQTADQLLASGWSPKNPLFCGVILGSPHRAFPVRA